MRKAISSMARWGGRFVPFGNFAKFAILVSLAGCGGGLFTPSEGPGEGRAGLTVTILWPERSEGRLIPQLTESIQLNLTDGATPVDSRLVPRPSSRIAFYSSRDGDWEIHVMNPDGSNQIQVTNNEVQDTDPSWSPDGSKIAFDTWRDGDYEIYVMNSDGSNQTRLTNNPAVDSEPSWSPF